MSNTSIAIFGYFNKIIEYHIAHKLPEQVTLYLSKQESKRIMEGFKRIGTSGLTQIDLNITTFLYGGFTFTLVHL